MNVGEYGISFNLNVNYDMSGFTSLSLDFTRPDGTTISRANGVVTVPSSPLVTPDGTFAANQYCTYAFQSGDINQEGTYSARLTYNDATKRLISDPVTFTINP